MLSEVEWISLLIQVPLVGIFIWFALKMQSEYKSERADRDRQWGEHLDRQWEQFRMFLSDERKSRDAAALKIADELTAITSSLVAVSAHLTAHDIRAAGIEQKIDNILNLTRVTHEKVVAEEKRDERTRPTARKDS